MNLNGYHNKRCENKLHFIFAFLSICESIKNSYNIKKMYLLDKFRTHYLEGQRSQSLPSPRLNFLLVRRLGITLRNNESN